jgi:hypothetical protein
MKLLRRHKAVLLVLGIYWPVIFWLTHIPVPDVARQSGMSDKTMHVLAYFVLTFLVWFAVSPYQKARWNRLKVWVVLATVIGYAAIDEYLQGYVGRSVDIQDFIADVFGVALALGMLSIFGFWSAMLMFSAVFIFIISNRSNLLLLYPQYHLNAVFHFTAYTAFELIWIQYLERRSNPPSGRSLWLMTSLAMPVLLLFGVKVTAAFFDRPFGWIDIATGLFGMCAAILISGAVFRVSGGKK